MKTYDERTRYILEQRDSRLAKRRKIRSVITTAALSACSLAIVAGTTVAMSRIHKNGGTWTSPNDSNTSSHGTAETSANNPFMIGNPLAQTNLPPEKIADTPSDELSFTMPEFPDVSFKMERLRITANGESLYCGMPICSTFLADLNEDGYREICSTASYSGLPGSYICAYDCVSGSLYMLSDSRGSYYITMDNDKLYYQFRANDSITGISDIYDELTLSAMEKASTPSNTETNLAPEKIYPRNSDDIDNILEINDDFSFTMPEFPNEEFKLKKGILYRGSLILYSGQPIHSLYLADLNGDGYREICSDVSIGLSGVIDMHIVAFDLVNNSLYELAADLGSEYHITFENGIIGYERGVYSETVFVDQKGVLDLSVMSKTTWIANYSYTKTETKPTPITIYERSSFGSDIFFFTMSEYPDYTLELRDNVFYINGIKTFIGEPIESIYLADLNGDGCREICSEAQMVWEPSVSGIIAVDCKSGEVYELSKTGYSYTLTLNDGELGYEYRRIGNTSSTPDSEGKLTLDIMGKG